MSFAFPPLDFVWHIFSHWVGCFKAVRGIEISLSGLLSFELLDVRSDRIAQVSRNPLKAKWDLEWAASHTAHIIQCRSPHEIFPEHGCHSESAADSRTRAANVLKCRRCDDFAVGIEHRVFAECLWGKHCHNFVGELLCKLPVHERPLQQERITRVLGESFPPHSSGDPVVSMYGIWPHKSPFPRHSSNEVLHIEELLLHPQSTPVAVVFKDRSGQWRRRLHPHKVVAANVVNNSVTNKHFV